MGQLEASTEGAAGAASDVTPGSITLAVGPIRPIGPPGRVPISGQTRQIFVRTPAATPGIVGSMIDHPPLPDFGDELGLYRLVRWARARVRASARPPAERAAILAEIEREYRAALEAVEAERRAGEKRPG